MASFNKVILLGRLTSDPELKQTQSGTPVISFSLAVDRKYTREGSEKQTDFISIIAWRQTAELISKYFRKGSSMLVEGELQTRTWTDKQGNKRYATDVVAGEVRFGETKRDREGNSVSDGQNATRDFFSRPVFGVVDAPNFANVVSDDDLPF